MLAGLSAGEVSPAGSILADKWNISVVVANLSITIFCIGFALAPMVLAPLSEFEGRRPIFLASGVLFVGAFLIFLFLPYLVRVSRPGNGN